MAHASAVSRIECEAPLLIKKAPFIVMAYRELLEAHPLGIFDSKCLPVPKPRMKAVLKQAYQRVETQGKRRVIERFYISLSSFQEGIGDTPIELDKPASAGPVRAMADRSLVRQIAEESRALLEEFNEFKQQLIERNR